MNKNEYLNALRHHLKPLPEEGRREVLHYYEGVFVRGLAAGRTEEAIAHELGDPRRLAADALGVPYDPFASDPPEAPAAHSAPMAPTASTAPTAPSMPPEPLPPLPNAGFPGAAGFPGPDSFPGAQGFPGAAGMPGRSGGGMRLFGVAVLLFFVNLIGLPLLASLWSAIAGILAGAVGAIAAPAAVLVDGMAHDGYYPASMYMSLAMTGVGILLMFAAVGLVKLGARATAGYFRWMARLWRGRS